MLIGYARVSTTDQNLDFQRDALTGAGCSHTFEEKKSSAPSGLIWSPSTSPT